MLFREPAKLDRFSCSIQLQRYPVDVETPLSNLFCTPSSVCISHVGGGFDLRKELKAAVGEPNSGHQQTSNEPKCVTLYDDRADEHVDWLRVSSAL